MKHQINVILMRGLLGNTYSRGMDALGAKLAKLPGVDYVTVEDYGSWRSIRDRITKWKDPTVLGGHSFGANAATIIAKSLHGIKFPLILTFDPSQHWSWSLWQSGPSKIGTNVTRAVNFYQTGGLIGRQQLSGSNVVNKIVSGPHTDVDDREHDTAIAEVKKVIGA